jgi:hypothetical protein
MRMRTLVRWEWAVWVAGVVLMSASVGRAGDDLARRIAQAKAGETIELPAGVFTGGVTLPPGVGIKGAGSDKTIIDAAASDVGISIEGGSGAGVSDLAIRGARRADLLVRDAQGVSVSRVRTTDSINGINFEGVKAGRIENTIVAGNGYGIIVGGGADNVIVNCTLTGNANLGISFPSGRHAVAFNNCITDGALGVFVADTREVRLDHNLYFTLITGSTAEQIGREEMTDWQYLSGLDAHSVRLPVKYRDAAAGDYRAANALDWAADRAVSSAWGTAKFEGVSAPDRDLAGAMRGPQPGVGALEAKVEAPRPPDGQFTVKGDEGVKSAGIFTADGREVAYLFHNLSLSKGTYPFWFPARDFGGRAIPAGDYQVRVAESNIQWNYLGWFGDNGEAAPMSHTAPVGPGWVAFDKHGHLLVGQGWSEDHTNLRAYDVKTGKVAWDFGGEIWSCRPAPGEGDTTYVLRSDDKQGQLSRVDERNGHVIPFEQAGGRVAYTLRPAHAGNAAGFAYLDGKLYMSDGSAGVIRAAGTTPEQFSDAIHLPAPSMLAADASRHLLWTISGGKSVMALSTDGKTVADSAPVEQPAALAVRGDLLAVASHATGKVHFFDCSDPTHLKPLRTLGKGDGPFGPFATDRFLFQEAPTHKAAHVELAIGPDGELAVGDSNRLLVFDAAGKDLWHTFGVFGNGTAPNYGDRRRVFDPEGRWSFLLDEQATGWKPGVENWKPDAFWDMPSQHLNGAFDYQGHTYGVFDVSNNITAERPITIARIENYRAVPVLQVVSVNGKLQWRRDMNHDGKLDASDGGEPLLDADGKQMPGDARLGPVDAKGNLGDWEIAKLDEGGAPIYKLREPLPPPFRPTGILSPYTHKPDTSNNVSAWALFPDGTRAANVYMNSSPLGAGLANGCGTDVAGFDAKGDLRWFHPLSLSAIYNMQTVGPVAFFGTALTNNVLAFNQDGLGLGGCSQPAGAYYGGFWLDHPGAIQAYHGHDGRTYVITADNSNGRHHWYRLTGEDQIVTSSFPQKLGEDGAKTLAAQAAPPPLGVVRPASPTVHIPALKEALPIDGALEKWRNIGIAPQVVLTPDTGHGQVGGPKETSAVIRLAWRDKDLYVQAIRFCTVVNLTQSSELHYKQDCLEMNLNGFANGFKFDIARTADRGDFLVRQRFFFGGLELEVPADVAPRVIRVLDNARDVPERKLIESVYGVDMSACKVIVTEFKLPIDERTYKGDEKAMLPMHAGGKFRLGFMIDTNDQPGTDVQNFELWPATYGTFNPPETMAEAVLEPAR